MLYMLNDRPYIWRPEGHKHLSYLAEIWFCLTLRNLDLIKGLPQQPEVPQGVPVRLGPRIFLTFGTTMVVGRQPYAQAAFTSGEIPGTHF